MTTMPRLGSTPFAFPEFRGATRSLVLWNLAAYFALKLAELAFPHPAIPFFDRFGFIPSAFLQHGWFWQPFTYSLVHPTLLGTLFELLSLWFIAGFLESYHTPGWVTSLYAASVLGTAAAAIAIYACSHALGYSAGTITLYGCFGGIFGLLVAIGVLYGDTQFMLFPLPIGIKARYLVAIYALVAFATLLFGEQRMYAFAQLGGALAGLLYLLLAPRRGLSLGLSEMWYALRNRYYRWKRRRAARKFEVYMRSQGRSIHVDGYGRPIDDDPEDKKRWN
jgi:membrane associated rhomboid family serine protease